MGQRPTGASLQGSKRIYLAVEKLGINTEYSTCCVRSKYDFLETINTAYLGKYYFYMVVVLLYEGESTGI